MNYMYLLLETFIVMLFMITSYMVYKKNGLYFFIGASSVIFSIVMSKLVSYLSFETNVGLALLMGIFICANIIIQRFGVDETVRIIKTFLFSYILSFIILNMVGMIALSSYNFDVSNYYNDIFGYNLESIRVFLSGLIVVPVILFMSGKVYYYFRRTQNKLWFSNLGTLFTIQFIQSLLFIFLSYVGGYSALELFGMVVVRYLIMVVVGIIGLIPVYIIVKMKDK